ncbi:MBOAT family O-acyltransferase [Capnocytophaga felis]|uniref:Alginate O-acetyltransferase n=1 Tax=Capnocytophaga felis TaxID=2267611 RepID=A0A5M4B6A9_9FLAO|nr:MBOAT family O-acyltransferase [Capnocytophaga felis]GET45151.1 alginate O-acetyltransferase [Capnocytophaga felis]GET47685.1 alginate O-acetyltransferase [Capnocytophaga felis]
MDFLTNFFSFDEKSPLNFVRIDFWIFFAIVYTVFAFIYPRKRLRNLFLLFASIYFYYKASGLFILLLLFSTITDFLLGNYIYQQTQQHKRKIAVTVSVIINLSVLAYFKYAYFFTDTYNALFNGNHQVFNYLAYWANGFDSQGYFRADTIILPVGISFYTFQTISYTVDIYRRKTAPLKSILDFGFYVSFFPQLVAGPIVRAENFVPQIIKKTEVTTKAFNKGTFMILKGLIKKMIFADFIAMHFLDQVFDNPAMFSGFSNVMALIGYSLQIYGDFAGYTDIAIGLALLMGFELPINFNSPYKAINCGDFWKRWHISLSTWLKDYLYIPLGGNRSSSVGTVIISLIFIVGVVIAANNLYFTLLVGLILIVVSGLMYISRSIERHVVTNINIMLTMLIGGLWHGASWKFVIWGGLNGVGILVYKYWRKISPYEKSSHWLATAWKILFTFAFITFTRIFFRGKDMESIAQWFDQVNNNMGWDSAWKVLVHYQDVFFVMLIGYIAHWLPQRWKDEVEHIFSESHLAVKGAIAIVVVIICYQAYSADLHPFIYFQF